MHIDDCVHVGTVTGISGKGELRVAVKNIPENIFLKVNAFLVDIDNELVPYFVKEVEIENGEAFVIFEDVESSVEARPFLHSKFYFPKKMLSTERVLAEKTFSVEGFSVVDDDHGEIGIINEVVEFPMQWMAKLEVEGKEVMFPLVEEIVYKVDDRKKMVYTRLPGGLLEIFLKTGK